MKRVTFIDLSQNDFDIGAAEFAPRRQIDLPDAYDLFAWYQEHTKVFPIEQRETKDMFTYVMEWFDSSIETRVVRVISVEQMGHDDEIDGKYE